MKHTYKITLILIFSFLLAQIIGLGIISQYMEKSPTGEVSFKELPIGDRPPVEENTSFIPVIVAILIGTGILLLLIKYGLTKIWKLWFFIAITIALAVVVFPFLMTILSKNMSYFLAFLIAIPFAAWKVFKPNVYVHNITELLVYGGIAAIFVPIFSISSIIILLLFIAGYDAYAVWKSKHMIILAKSQTKEKVFAGLFIPYKIGSMKKPKKNKSVKKIPIAVLGGGDIAFPLIFSGVMLKEFQIGAALITTVTATIALALLLFNGKKEKFYPAMPFITAGCLIGYGIVFLIF